MLLETVAASWRKLKSTNFTDTSFATVAPTLTMPSGDGVVLGTGETSQNAIIIRPFGTSADNQTFKIRVYGYSPCIIPSAGPSWEYVLLADLLCTLGNITGTASCAITATDYECDTISEVTTCGVDIISPASDIRGACAVIDTRGSQILRFLFDRNSSAASANLLYRGY